MKIKRYLIIDISFVAMTTNLYAYSLYRFGVSEIFKSLFVARFHAEPYIH